MIATRRWFGLTMAALLASGCGTGSSPRGSSTSSFTPYDPDEGRLALVVYFRAGQSNSDLTDVLQKCKAPSGTQVETADGGETFAAVFDVEDDVRECFKAAPQVDSVVTEK